jgi:N-acetylglutamate synthase-like GNAT family acetyltransferase
LERELALANWDDGQKQRYLRTRFSAQIDDYARQRSLNDLHDFHVILQNGEPVGRLCVQRHDHEIRIADVTLLPEYRIRETWLPLLKSILAEAQQRGLPARLHVEGGTPAAKFYAQLGFKRIAFDGLLDEMEWRPAAGGPQNSSFVARICKHVRNWITANKNSAD